MKAVIENVEPVIRPVTIRPVTAPPTRRSRIEFVPVRTDNRLFHAWRA